MESMLIGIVREGGPEAIIGLFLWFMSSRLGRVEKKLDNGLCSALHEVKEKVVALATRCDERSEQYHEMQKKMAEAAAEPEYCEGCRPRGQG